MPASRRPRREAPTPKPSEPQVVPEHLRLAQEEAIARRDVVQALVDGGWTIVNYGQDEHGIHWFEAERGEDEDKEQRRVTL